jgi:hypothetical protein
MERSRLLPCGDGGVLVLKGWMMNKSWLFVALVSVSLAGCMGSHAERGEHEGENGEANEVKVPFEQVPAAAQATLTREAEGAAITSVDMEKDEGTAVYEADAMIGGTNYEIKVDASGKLLSKKLDKEEDEKGEHEDKGEKGDKD